MMHHIKAKNDELIKMHHMIKMMWHMKAKNDMPCIKAKMICHIIEKMWYIMEKRMNHRQNEDEERKWIKTWRKKWRCWKMEKELKMWRLKKVGKGREKNENKRREEIEEINNLLILKLYLNLELKTLNLLILK